MHISLTDENFGQYKTRVLMENVKITKEHKYYDFFISLIKTLKENENNIIKKLELKYPGIKFEKV